MARFGYRREELDRHAVTPAFRELMAFECERTRALFKRGLVLGVDARAGARPRDASVRRRRLAILDRLEAVGYDAFTARPTLSRWAKMALVARALVGGVG